MSTVTTDIRCPTGSNSLLLRVLSEGRAPIQFVSSQLLQLYCKECTKDFRRINGSDRVLRVLHLFTTNGEFQATQIQFRDGDEQDIDLDTQIKILKLSTQFKPSKP